MWFSKSCCNVEPHSTVKLHVQRKLLHTFQPSNFDFALYNRRSRSLDIWTRETKASDFSSDPASPHPFSPLLSQISAWKGRNLSRHKFFERLSFFYRETMVLRRWGEGNTKIGYEKSLWGSNYHREEIAKLTFPALVLRFHSRWPRLTLQDSFSQFLYGGNLTGPHKHVAFDWKHTI